MKPLRATSAAFTLLMAGCTVGPNYTPPEPPKVQAWRNHQPNDPAVSLDTDPDPRWWAAFGDPVLTELIQTAIRDNLDVQQAVLRVVESRQGIVTAEAAGLPKLNGTASYMREQLGAKGILESKGVYAGLNKLADDASNAGATSALASSGVPTGSLNKYNVDSILNQITQPVNLFQYGLSASWELDLFGRIRRLSRTSRALTQAQGEAANDALTSLESEVAPGLRPATRRPSPTRHAGNQRPLRRELPCPHGEPPRRPPSPPTSTLTRPGTQLLTLQRQLPEYDKQEKQAIDRINLLIGKPPGTLEDRLLNPPPLPSLPNAVGVGLPSKLARRRPDIRQAEAQLHAATAGVGVAVASFYPDVSLTGNLGIRATDASYLTRWASHFYSAGPSLSLPIFEGGQLTANLRMNRAQAAEAALHYRATVLNALREVEDSLIAFNADRDERDRLAAVVRSGEDTLYLSNSRYTHGLSDFLTVLDAQRSVEDARQQLEQQEITLANDVVGLYRALGGGWESPGVNSQAPVPHGAPPPVPAALDSVAGGS